jgi:hypothetical protein
MSFDAIIGSQWTAIERATLAHEAEVAEKLRDQDLVERIRAAKQGYREAMESTGISLDGMDVPDVYEALYGNPWEDLYEDWEEGAEYAHDEDDE